MRAFIISFFVVIFISAISFQATYAQQKDIVLTGMVTDHQGCLLYTSPSPRDCS